MAIKYQYLTAGNKPPPVANRYFLLTFDGHQLRELVTEAEQDAASGGEHTVVTVVQKAECHYVLEADQYYFPDGKMVLEITQPLERALRTYGALLMADSLIESGR